MKNVVAAIALIGLLASCAAEGSHAVRLAPPATRSLDGALRALASPDPARRLEGAHAVFRAEPGSARLYLQPLADDDPDARVRSGVAALLESSASAPRD